jgi:nitroreductase
MYLFQLAKKRRSIRCFRRENICIDDLNYILNVARHAPSGANRQPWRFILVFDDERKMRIREICEEIEKRFYERAPEWFVEWAKSRGISWRKPHLTEASVLIFVFGKRGEPYWMESVWLMIGYLLLAAEEKGYATLTYTPSDTRWVHDFFGVPKDFVLQTIIPVGRADERPAEPGRHPLEELVYVEKWGERIESNRQ